MKFSHYEIWIAVKGVTAFFANVASAKTYGDAEAVIAQLPRLSNRSYYHLSMNFGA